MTYVAYAGQFAGREPEPCRDRLRTMISQRKLVALLLLGWLVACSDSRASATSAGRSSAAQSSTVSSGAPPTSESLAGRKFNITRISVDGQDQPIVAATNPAIVFTPTQVQIDTGCNGITGEYAIADGQMTVTHAVQTAMGCLPPTKGVQEDSIRRAVDGTAVLESDREGFTVTTGPVTIELSPA